VLLHNVLLGQTLDGIDFCIEEKVKEIGNSLLASVWLSL
jgi:hypothetical protein